MEGICFLRRRDGVRKGVWFKECGKDWRWLQWQSEDVLNTANSSAAIENWACDKGDGCGLQGHGGEGERTSAEHLRPFSRLSPVLMVRFNDEALMVRAINLPDGTFELPSLPKMYC